MTKPHLLGLAKVRRALVLPIFGFTCLNAARTFRELGSVQMVLQYLLFDTALWLGTAFLIFAVIEWRQSRRPQPRLVAMTMAVVGIATLSTTLITLRALFESIVWHGPFASRWWWYLPGHFYIATFYVAIVTGIGYAVHSWAIEERRMAEAAELEVAVARAKLKEASGRLPLAWLDAALLRLSALMTTDPALAQRLIADLGALLHHSLAQAQSASAPFAEELDHAQRFRDFQQAIGASAADRSALGDDAHPVA